MVKRYTENYKICAVKYYLDNDMTMRETCNIFKCNYKLFGQKNNSNKTIIII